MFFFWSWKGKRRHRLWKASFSVSMIKSWRYTCHEDLKSELWQLNVLIHMSPFNLFTLNVFSYTPSPHNTNNSHLNQCHVARSWDNHSFLVGESRGELSRVCFEFVILNPAVGFLLGFFTYFYKLNQALGGSTFWNITTFVCSICGIRMRQLRL